MRKQNRTNSLLASLLITFSAPVLSHTGAEVTHSFIAGLIHPWLGIDHILVMFAIGLWSRVQGGKQVWLLPLTFLFWMTTGAALGFANNSLPYPELWVTLSVIVFGLLVVNNRKVNPVWAMTLVALFALGHGYVHATEIPKNADQSQYALGFLITTVILHSLGIMVGIVSTKKLQMIRINFGLLCAAVGVMLLAG
jgi:urease accessory protein